MRFFPIIFSLLGTSSGLLCSYSNVHQIALVLIPKSGSSTGRHLFKHELGGIDIPCSSVPKNTTMIATLRDPYKRFMSSYDEAFVRHLGRPRDVPVRYRFPFLQFDGLTYPEYEKLFNTKVLDQAFEDFVMDYDGKQVFDTHLQLQHTGIEKYGVKLYGSLSWIMDNVLQSLVPDKELEYIKGRAYPRRFNVNNLTDKTIEKICWLVREDYCKLNIELTKPCVDYISKNDCN